jgi:UDP:flavonoid glycosyltransferase YjiC (YdhE family)
MSEAERRLRVLFVAEAVTLAHVARAHALSLTLEPSKYEVHLAWDPRYNHLLGDLRNPFHPVTTLPTELFLRRVAQGVPMHDLETLRGYVDEDLEIIKLVQPDLIVSDFRLSQAVSARLAGVHLLAVSNAYWSPYANQSFMFDHYDYPLGNVVGKSAAKGLFRLFRRLGFAAHTLPLNRLCRQRGLDPIGFDLRRMYTFGDATAYADIPGLVPTTAMPPRHRFIGAVLWSPAVPLPDWWEAIKPNRPVVYVTLGSSGDMSALPTVLEALGGMDVEVVAATAGRDLPTEPRGSNVHVAHYLPGETAVRCSTLVVCNGGSPTTSQALAAGVPVLGLVSNNMDQQLNMEAVSKAGAGETLRARGVTAAQIAALAASLLSNPTYRRAAAALAESHAQHAASKLFPAFIDGIVGRHKTT